MVRRNTIYLRIIYACIIEAKLCWRAIDVGLIAIASIYLTKDALTHVGACHDVDSLISLAIVHARELGIIRKLVKHLDTVNSLCWERVEGCRYILAKELLAINEDFFDLLALSLHLTICDGYTRHLLDEALDIGIRSHLERRSIVGYSIAILRCAQRMHLLDNSLDSHTRSKLHDAQIHCARHLYIGRICRIADKRHRHGVVASSKSCDGNTTAHTCCVVLAHIGIALRRKLNDSADNAILGLHIHDLSRNLSRLCHGWNRQA